MGDGPVECDGPARRIPRRRNPGAILGRAVTRLPVAAFLNHLLEAAPWARDRLAPFAGRTWRVELAPLPDLSFVVRENGMLDASDALEPHLVVTLTPAALPALARRDETVIREMTFAGDAELAAALQYLARHLEWDVEEDLSRVVGDVAAHRRRGRPRLRRVAEQCRGAARRQRRGVPHRRNGSLPRPRRSRLRARRRRAARRGRPAREAHRAPRAVERSGHRRVIVPPSAREHARR